MLDENGRELDHRPLWAEAHTLADIGGLTAQWLEGRITYLPTCWAPGPNPETAELIPVLAASNRAGFVTDSSQPGIPMVEGSGQRAAVWGYCSEDLFGLLRVAAVGSELVILAFPPGTECRVPGPVGSGPQVGVTAINGDEVTWLGHPTRAVDIDCSYGVDLPSDGVAALHAAWELHMFDPRWGRNDLLWSFLTWVTSRAVEWLDGQGGCG